MGIAYSLTCDAKAQTLLKNADMALYEAKAAGRGTFHFFDPVMNVQAQRRHALETGLRSALANAEFELFFQPILNTHTEVLNRFEALIRWRHPERGLIEPSEFIPLAEEIGLVIPIGEWVLQEACCLAADWPRDIPVAVNISAVQLKSTNLFNVVREALRISRLPPSRLELGITETVLLQTTTKAVHATLRGLRSWGLGISLDDFGIGHSSISCSRAFPFDRVKIDQSFVRSLGVEIASTAIVHAIVNLGHAFGMSITAEGVEIAEQLGILQAESCAEVQGYLFSAPVPATEVPSLIVRMGSRSADVIV